MKLRFGFVVFLMSFSFLFSQDHLVDVTVIKPNNDTLRGKAKIMMDFVAGASKVDESAFYRKIKLVDETGKKVANISPSEIREFSFTDLSGKKRVYHKDPSKNQLMELLYNGKMKLYLQFVPMTHFMGYHYHYENEDGKPYKVGLFENDQKILMRITSSKPEVQEKVRSIYSQKGMIDILAEFEQEEK